MNTDLLFKSDLVKVRAINFCELINVRALRSVTNVYNNPCILRAGIEGYAVVYRFGSIVFFNTSDREQAEFIASIESNITNQLDGRTTEEADLRIIPSSEFSIINNFINTPKADISLLVMIADVLAKSVTLERIENSIAKSFETAEMLSRELKHGRISKIAKITLLKQMGEMLIQKQGLFSRMEISDKPDLLWDNPALEGTYRQLTAEYELADRQALLVKKLDLILTISQTGFDIIQTERSLRVEWYIVGLIVFEIVLSLKDMLFA